ncbi:hypothetical protein K438DRAFT_1753616 [Mycena galopus ATCC 62051]|nr:hypothetical protein K438DRAFT_1753616 [Mycena galopus ATCC 62051]
MPAQHSRDRRERKGVLVLALVLVRRLRRHEQSTRRETSWDVLVPKIKMNSQPACVRHKRERYGEKPRARVQRDALPIRLHSAWRTTKLVLIRPRTEIGGDIRLRYRKEKVPGDPRREAARSCENKGQLHCVPRLASSPYYKMKKNPAIPSGEEKRNGTHFKDRRRTRGIPQPAVAVVGVVHVRPQSSLVLLGKIGAYAREQWRTGDGKPECALSLGGESLQVLWESEELGSTRRVRSKMTFRPESLLPDEEKGEDASRATSATRNEIASLIAPGG